MEEHLKKLIQKSKLLLGEIKTLRDKYTQFTFTSVEFPVETFMKWSFIPLNFEATFIKWECNMKINEYNFLTEKIRELKCELKKGKKRKRSIELASDTEYESDVNDPKYGILGFIPVLEGLSLIN